MSNEEAPKISLVWTTCMQKMMKYLISFPNEHKQLGILSFQKVGAKKSKTIIYCKCFFHSGRRENVCLVRINKSKSTTENMLGWVGICTHTRGIELSTSICDMTSQARGCKYVVAYSSLSCCVFIIILLNSF